ncbi:DUF1344 domain-containing protein [Peteryoungia desertarenae]|uniref:DUF1344 domain-containing protein n=1 Tax=Peteryoungia desertarenae TaxID=1813451 RepID=A0ABX6QT10_9HYPH|nr:DUF1344 domain-containing protein [Peteryoungia desertarenae]QLF71340.1 DUF1344 domain-containing protein [Peteryoungia desertarenae]
MRMLVSILFATASLLSPLAALASDDVEAVITAVNQDSMTLELDDGKTYTVPAEFNFEGLQSGARVLVFYTEVDGSRVIEDMQVLE